MQVQALELEPVGRVEALDREVAIFERCFRQVEREFGAADDKLKFNEALKRMLDRMVTDLIENTRHRLRESGVGTVEEVRRWPERLAAFSAEVDAERAQAKRFLSEKLYHSESLRPQKADGEKIIHGLFGYWMEHPAALPESYQAQITSDDRARVICDYIAGMTDNYILDLYRKLSGRAVAK